MTGNTNKTRAVFLAMLMVLSVFAGTVAFSGSAAATAPSYDGNAVHYVNSSGVPVIEVPFTGNVSEASADTDNFTVLDDGDNNNGTDYTITDIKTSPNSTVEIVLDSVISSEDIEVDISENVESAGNEPIGNDGEKSVVFAGQTLEHDTAENGSSDGGADSQANKPENVTAYQGVTLAVNASNVTNQEAQSGDFSFGDVDVVVEGEDNNYFQEGSTGTNSTVFTFDTSDRELGQYKIYLNRSDNEANRTYVDVRNLGLDISVDDANVTTDDTIETDVSAVAGGRDIQAELLDSNGDEVNTSGVTTLDGQGEADVDFETSSADGGDELDTGTYTVEVTDDATGIVVESTEIQVSEADDEEAEFTQNTISEERGDILEVTVEMTETDEATINFGSADDGVEANATVEDDNDDDQVTVYINTYRMSASGDLPNSGGDVFNLDSDSDDTLVDQDITTETGDLIDAGDYDLEVQAGDQDFGDGSNNVGIEPDSSDDVATVTLNERSTDGIVMHTGSAEEIGSFSDLEDVNDALDESTLTESSEVAVGDLAVHAVQASGLEGALNARENEQVTTEFTDLDTDGPLNLTIEEADAGANQDAQELNLTPNNLTVIADGPNDTYFVVVDTSDVTLDDGDGSNSAPLPDDDDTALETNFTVLQDDAGDFDFTPDGEFDDDENSETFVEFDANEPDINVDEPFNVSQAEGQTVSGDTNIAPGTELSLRIRSDSDVSPSFLKTASPVVQSDGTYSATFDFSEQSVGDTYDIEVNSNTLPDGPVEEEGTVVEAVATDTTTPEPTDTDTATATPEPTDTATATPEPTDTATAEPTEEPTDEPTSTPTSTPGFGIVVALTALLAAALLAVRRNN
ncbi:hypothetical protein GCM10008995_09760 [Halobellus salinus]|uniref:PGF-CTERM sorting domain-containing protein n=1 Tax=Halobellus salinus TaxID=931585 RepID=A0A830E8Z5_9EURY|nr:BGTF surface domain-containing protein [Halobellus salinus]GGJ02013.1 hypothetical protein GCM10008995_09760 [Halobellus salinus]SMP17935.1 PGF-CTERM protein/surface glycoprotein [Halobellus salinus]